MVHLGSDVFSAHLPLHFLVSTEYGSVQTFVKFMLDEPAHHEIDSNIPLYGQVF